MPFTNLSAIKLDKLEAFELPPPAPDKLDDFEDLLLGYGIVELQRTGRVALPKLDREARTRAANHNKGKAG